MVHTAKDRN